MRRIDPDLDADLQRFVERAAAQIAVPPRPAQRTRRLAVLPLLGMAAALVLVGAAAFGLGRALNDARRVVATQPAAVSTQPRSPGPSRQPTDLPELPDERAVLAAFNAGGLSVSTIGGSKDEGELGVLLPARAFIVSSGPSSGGFGVGADVLFLKGTRLGEINVCGAPGNPPGRVRYSTYVNGQRTAGADAISSVYYLASSDYFAIAYDTRSRDALVRGLGLVAPQCPDRVTIGGHSYRLTANLWRDFMPIAPSGGRPLIASLILASEDGSAFPLAIVADQVWVFNADQTWDASSIELRRAPDAGTPSNTVEVVARDGPKWDPGTRVDVVVRVRAAGVEYLIGLRGVEIKMTS